MYPQGLPTVGQLTDPEGRRPGWQHVPSGEGGRDLKFVDVMLAWARKERRVDAARVFAAGHSNGGSMVYVLWAARAREFTAFAPSSSVFRPDVIANGDAKAGLHRHRPAGSAGAVQDAATQPVARADTESGGDGRSAVGWNGASAHVEGRRRRRDIHPPRRPPTARRRRRADGEVLQAAISARHDCAHHDRPSLAIAGGISWPPSNSRKVTS